MLILLQKKVPPSRFWLRRRQSIDLDDAIREDEFAVGTAPSSEDPDMQLSSNSASTVSLHVQVSYQTEKNLKEEWAATVIQTAFRAFLVYIILSHCVAIVKVVVLPFCMTIISNGPE